MLRIGIYGGTFSPPHNGHVAAAKAFMEQMWLDILYVIPTATPPHKAVAADVTALDRLEMCRLAFDGIEGVMVSDLEIRRGGTSYTVDTLRELAGEDRRLFFLCGTDMMLTLDRWRESQEIFRLCYPVYIRRERDPILEGQIVAKNQLYQEKYGRIVRRLMADVIELSSTEIRDRVKSGAEISDLVPTPVADYIKSNGLYR